MRWETSMATELFALLGRATLSTCSSRKPDDAEIVSESHEKACHRSRRTRWRTRWMHKANSPGYSFESTPATIIFTRSLEPHVLWYLNILYIFCFVSSYYLVQLTYILSSKATNCFLWNLILFCIDFKLPQTVSSDERPGSNKAEIRKSKLSNWPELVLPPKTVHSLPKHCCQMLQVTSKKDRINPLAKQPVSAICLAVCRVSQEGCERTQPNRPLWALE